jgi:hypothetical protein
MLDASYNTCYVPIHGKRSCKTRHVKGENHLSCKQTQSSPSSPASGLCLGFLLACACLHRIICTAHKHSN